MLKHKTFVRTISRVPVALMAALLFVSASPAQKTASITGRAKKDQQAVDGVFSSEDFGDVKGHTTIEQDNKVELHRVPLNVRIAVPHNNGQVNSFMIYPYPVQPPRIRKANPVLPETPAQLKGMLIGAGYERRQQAENHAYPVNGWRFQYAYKAALKKSGKMQPIILPQIYAWASSMVPYMQEECERLNDLEVERGKRYNRAVQEFLTQRADIETEAVHKELYPCELRINRTNAAMQREGRVELLPGNWWIVGTHKVPGLTYYWQLPVSIQEGDPAAVDLTEENALVIEGGW